VGIARADTIPDHAQRIHKETTMAKLFAIYQQPADPARFDSYYFNTHVPLAKTIPGLRSYEVTRGAVMGMAGRHAVYLVAVLEFDSMESIAAAMASPQGQATAADLANFASAGVDVMMADTSMV
jgi:uncharacterized protein (TIGR02118 family)